MRGVGLVGSRREVCPTWWLLGRQYPGLEGGPCDVLAPCSVAPFLKGSPAISCQMYVSRTYSTRQYLGVWL
jgi:hypothetical protein